MSSFHMGSAEIENTRISHYLADNERWTAVLRRDARADTAFVYAVKTTGVYCRATCRARRPKRGHVVFFDTALMAEQAGYRACRKCRPDARPSTHRHLDAIVAACRRIERAEAAPRLAELAEQAGLSPFHFQRVFKSIVGVSPKQYALARRANSLRNNLRRAHTVADAMYAAGFQSNGRLYEKSGDVLGMAPSRYRAGGRDESIRYAVRKWRLGWVLAAATDRGICAIEFGEDPATLRDQLSYLFSRAEIQPDERKLRPWMEHLAACVADPIVSLELPLDIRGTAFQQRVWRELQRIPLGQTRTYQQIARAIGSPRAVRAVARACAANRLAVAIPCHRAVRSDGSLAGYRWGVKRKRILLEKERSISKPQPVNSVPAEVE